MERFIVGTGRCGSTLLSRMLAEYPPALSIFEFFNGLDRSRRFQAEPMPGAEFAAMISQEQPFVRAVIARGYEVEEIRYPFDSGGRYRRDERLPWLLVSMLPRLVKDPDALFDALVVHAQTFPTRAVREHYRALFDWLAKRLGKQLWIERAGSSVEYLGELQRVFPEARFVHIHRDGREAALSMREHHAYRLPISILYQAPTDSGALPAELGPLDLDAPPHPTDVISQILASRPPVEYFGRYWTDQLVRGLEALAVLGKDRYLAVSFENLLTDPLGVLHSIAAFFELDPQRDPWMERAAGLIRGRVPTRFERLPKIEQAALAEACRVGQQLLGRLP